jgi:hypothetical protein
LGGEIQARRRLRPFAVMVLVLGETWLNLVYLL